MGKWRNVLKGVLSRLKLISNSNNNPALPPPTPSSSIDSQFLSIPNPNDTIAKDLLASNDALSSKKPLDKLQGFVRNVIRKVAPHHAQVKANLLSGVPLSLSSPNRTLYIYAQPRSITQSGTAPQSCGGVIATWDSRTVKWTNRLIGWRGSADPVQGLAQSGMRFENVEGAVRWAMRQGVNWQVLDALSEQEQAEAKREQKMRPKSYGENFEYSPEKKLRQIITK